MTRENAIAVLMAQMLVIGKGFPKYQEAMELAIAALREQEKLESNLKVLESRGWISVEERLPEEWKSTSGDFINYMVFMPEYGVDIGNYLQPANGWMCMGIPCEVTHWMPLPSPPEVEV